jgi:RNA polymerase sigma factor (sigma-70 family)
VRRARNGTDFGYRTLLGMSNTRDAASSADLWSRVLRGDTAAFGAVFDLHRDRVFGQALRLVRSVDDAEDVTALVFLEAWRKRFDVRVVDGSILGWLLVTTNYVVRNVQRTARRHAIAMARMPRPVDAPDHAGAIHDELDSLVARNAVGLAFGQLSSRDQDVLTLCVLEELSEAEASAALGVPAGTIKSRLSRAKKRLAALVAEGTRISLEGQTSPKGQTNG